jgi:hypothetical protein
LTTTYPGPSGSVSDDGSITIEVIATDIALYSWRYARDGSSKLGVDGGAVSVNHNEARDGIGIGYLRGVGRITLGPAENLWVVVCDYGGAVYDS